MIPARLPGNKAIWLVIGTMAGLIGPWTVNGFLQSMQERVTFPMIVAEIDSYRRLPPAIQCSPQVANTIAVWNARIVHEHESNRLWYSDLFSTDRWLEVEPVELACGSAWLP